MKTIKTLQWLFLAFLTAAFPVTARAVAAWPEPMTATQPDGSTITILLHGDEFYNYAGTTDGYTLLQRSTDKAWVYAEPTGTRGALRAGDIIAHNLNSRTAREKTFTARTEPHLIDLPALIKGNETRDERDYRTKSGGRPFDFSHFRGLVILVEFKDCRFSRGDIKNFYHRLFNEADYTGFSNPDGSPNPNGKCTGSVRDYFHDNSGGQFTPQFDVYGPVTVNNYSVNSFGSFALARNMFQDLMKQIDGKIDCSPYDNNNDGYIDAIFFVLAGTAASSSPDSKHLWPHQWTLNGIEFGGKRAGRYACATEFDSGKIGTIGTICHEFSHVLGLPDLYDRDDKHTEIKPFAPGWWEIMSTGCYNNSGRTPAGYSLYDRYALGFVTPKVITSPGDYTLNPIGYNGEGYILTSPNEREKFLIENRQQATKWDKYVPGNGMIIARMDSTDATPWHNLAPNSDRTHYRYELLNTADGSGNRTATLFPGENSRTTVTNTSAPCLKTFDGKANAFVITDIAMRRGVISFTVRNATWENSQGMSRTLRNFAKPPKRNSDRHPNTPNTRNNRNNRSLPSIKIPFKKK